MPKRIVPLSDIQVNKAKPKDKDYKLSDGGGLYLLVTMQKYDKDGKAVPASKLWRYQYRFNGKQKLLALGQYPVITLAEARNRRENARKLLANGIDPSDAKKAHKQAGEDRAADSFEVIAREWHNAYQHQWTPGHTKKLLSRMEKEIFPYIGAMPIEEIKAPDVLKILKRIESRGILETAHRVKTIISQVLRYAIAHGRRADRGSQGRTPAGKSQTLWGTDRPERSSPPVKSHRQFSGKLCSLSAPYSFLLCCSAAQGIYGAWNGQKLTLTQLNGTSPLKE